MTEMYGSYSDEDLNEWERMPQNIRVLTSSAFGAWLLRRDKRIKEQEPKTEWIPVSERLPEEDGYYITTTLYREVYCDYWNGETFERTEIVLAWMQKPEPYKGSEG